MNKIKTETGTSIIIPPDDNKSDVIRIEGDPKGVAAAKSMLLEMAARMVRGEGVREGGWGGGVAAANTGTRHGCQDGGRLLHCTCTCTCIKYNKDRLYKIHCTYIHVQWNLRIKDTWGPEQVSFIQRLEMR